MRKKVSLPMVPLVESSEESEEQDDVMSLEEEEELRARVRRAHQSGDTSRRHSIVDLRTDHKGAGKWSRRSSLVGNDYLRIDDEMVTVNRLGSVMQIPRRLSHHVPRMPILDSEEYSNKLQKFKNLDMDEFNLYKLATVQEYNKAQVASMSVAGDHHHFTLANMKAHNLFRDGSPITSEEQLDILKDTMGSRSLKEMEKLLAAGMTREQVIEHFRKLGRTESQESQEVLDALEKIRSQMDLEELRELEAMLARGMSMEECLEYFLAKQRLQGLAEEDEPEIMDCSGKGERKEAEEKLEEEAIAIVKVLLSQAKNQADLNYHLVLSMLLSAKVTWTFFVDFPTVQDILDYIVPNI